LYGGTKQRYRSRLVGGEQQRVVYTLEQPKMFALYRHNFIAVDVMNRLSQGPGCLYIAWRTYNVHHRLFAASLSTCMTNANSAWLQVHQLTTQHYPQKKFTVELAESSIKKMHEVRSNGEVQARGRAAPPEAAESSITRVPPAFQGHRPKVSEKHLVCVVCKQHQSGLVCECEAHICSPSTKGRTRYLVRQRRTV
jgi:hypothetical protein